MAQVSPGRLGQDDIGAWFDFITKIGWVHKACSPFPPDSRVDVGPKRRLIFGGIIWNCLGWEWWILPPAGHGGYKVEAYTHTLSHWLHQNAYYAHRELILMNFQQWLRGDIKCKLESNKSNSISLYTSHRRGACYADGTVSDSLDVTAAIGTGVLGCKSSSCSLMTREADNELAKPKTT